MQALSTASTATDGYRAGCALAEGVAAVSPEVVILFASIDYEPKLPDLLDGLYDTLGSRDVVVFGGSGDGVLESSRVASHHGVAALGLNSGGRVSWTTAVEAGVAEDSRATARRCAQGALARAPRPPCFAMVLANGVKADGQAVVEGVGEVLAVPFFGGMTADDRRFARSFVCVGNEVHHDVVAVLLACGEVSFAINAASGWTPVGQPGRVDRSRGNRVESIAGISPRAFIREQLGKSLGEVDLGIVPLATSGQGGADHHALRTFSHVDEATGALTTFGRIPQGSVVRVCDATREDVLRGVEDAVGGVREAVPQPVAALVVSCAGRKWLMDDNCAEEVERLFSSLGRRVPLVGFPSFGEMGPFRKPDGGYSPTLFHNVTYVVCLLGA
jgi:hypothetical protein